VTAVEIVVVVLAVAVSCALVAAVVGVVVVEVDDPAQDTTAVSQLLGGMLTAFAGVVVGYVLGRR
jgi:hypothetical protein